MDEIGSIRTDLRFRARIRRHHRLLILTIKRLTRFCNEYWPPLKETICSFLAKPWSDMAKTKSNADARATPTPLDRGIFEEDTEQLMAEIAAMGVLPRSTLLTCN